VNLRVCWVNLRVCWLLLRPFLLERSGASSSEVRMGVANFYVMAASLETKPTARALWEGVEPVCRAAALDSAVSSWTLLALGRPVACSRRGQFPEG
jgi:hypothetical protein